MGPTPLEPQEIQRPTSGQIQTAEAALASAGAVEVPTLLKDHVHIVEAAGLQYVSIESLKTAFHSGSFFISRSDPSLPFDSGSYLGAVLMYKANGEQHMASDFEQLKKVLTSAKEVRCYYVRVLNPRYVPDAHRQWAGSAVQLHSFTMSRASTDVPFGIYMNYLHRGRMTEHVQGIIDAKRKATSTWSPEMRHVRCFTNTSHFYRLYPGDTVVYSQDMLSTTQIAVRLATTSAWRLCDRSLHHLAWER